MGGQRSLLKSLEISTAGRLHYCHSNKRHALRKGDVIFIVSEGRNHTHYCVDCALRFVATAQAKLAILEGTLRQPS